ncbi:MAG: MATE family efflux transporter [Lachnospiraceae bacterium]|nr:MATE family efflux transporter [Lachnospiraceae bacterium]
MHNKSKHLFNTVIDLTEGPILKGISIFCIPLLLGQIMQQLYNLADAYVIGHFASISEFAAVSSTGSLSFFVIGFFSGMSVGGGVIISKYFGAKDEKNVERAIHTNFLFGIIASVVGTIVGELIISWLLTLMDTPGTVMPYATLYLRIIFGGISMNVMYNICMAIMRALGDSVSPLIFLGVSSILNIGLDFLLVGLFGMGVAGAAVATVMSQAVSVVFCVLRMTAYKDEYMKLKFKAIKWHGSMMKEVVLQGIPTGIQNSVISIGNMTIQKNVNDFGDAAMAGMGAYHKIEGFVFLPINCLSMALPTFVSQNLGARKYDRAKRGATGSLILGMAFSELIGFVMFWGSHPLLKFFISDETSIEYGMIHARVTSLFFLLLAFSHCAAGVMRGCGKSVVPMVTMLAFWCIFRVTYVTVAIRLFPVFQTISWAYPITWSLSSIVFILFLLFSDWTHSFEKSENKIGSKA